MEKRCRFENGFIGTLREFAEKYGVAKVQSFASLIKPAGPRRENQMDYWEREEYENKRQYAKPTYFVRAGESALYSIPKNLYEKLDLPVEHEKYTSTRFPVWKPLSPIRSSYHVPYKHEQSYKDAMKLYQKDAEKMAVSLLFIKGYIHTGNFYLPYKVTSRINNTDVDVTVEVAAVEIDDSSKKDRFEFHFGSVYVLDGCSETRLYAIDRTKPDGSPDRVLNYANFTSEAIDRATFNPYVNRSGCHL